MPRAKKKAPSKKVVKRKIAPPKKRAAKKRAAVAKSPKPKRRKSIGRMVDAYDVADFEVKKVEAHLSAVKKIREALSNELQDAFTKDELRGASGATGLARIALTTTKSPSLTDRSAFERYVLRKKAFELFQGRVNKAAWLERVESDGKPIPGVETFEKTTIRLTRSK